MMKLFPSETLFSSRIPLIVYPFESVSSLENYDLSRVAAMIPTQTPLDTKFIIAMPWKTNIGNTHRVPNYRLAVDYHCYHDFNGDWEDSNPTRTSIPVLNCRPMYAEGTSCEIATIILGIEAQHRRGTSNLEEYLELRPKIPESFLLEE